MTTNLDVFFGSLLIQGIDVDEEVKTESRIYQRVMRITPNTTAGMALLSRNIHSASQVVSMGANRFTDLMVHSGSLDRRTANTVYRLAEHQQSRTLQLLTEYRHELHRSDPRAIVDHTYRPEELEAFDNASLETLFGSLDFCECPHCQSVYGPAAYLTDVLRFLDRHDSEISISGANAKRTVRDILFDRRPDLGAIKLNCANTETPLPYIDLVCEILEYAVPLFFIDVEFHHELNSGVITSWMRTTFSAHQRTLGENATIHQESSGHWRITDEHGSLRLIEVEKGICVYEENTAGAFQTTRSANELRAVPENVRSAAYERLREADYPMNVAFDLWQEESRVFLQHLGAPRRELMEALQPVHADDDDSQEISISGEFWGMSTHETALVTNEKSTAEWQNAFWGLTENSDEMSVADFLGRTRLDYRQMLDLLYVQWINPWADPHKMMIAREETCDTKNQTLTGLSLERLDKIHRFLRLWRKTSWKMWELDLLIRTQAIGGGLINGRTLFHLKQIRQLQDRLGLDVEQLISLFDQINTEVRVNPEKPREERRPLYLNLFLNPVVSREPDERFRLYWENDNHLFVRFPELLTPGIPLSDVRATLSAAFALTETDRAALCDVPLANNKEEGPTPSDRLTLARLSLIGRYVFLARGLGLRITELIPLISLLNIPDVFVSPRATLDFIEAYEWIGKSGFTAEELDYLLNYKPDSPYAPGDDVITQRLATLRQELEGCAADAREKVIMTQVATAFSLTVEQAQSLLTHLTCQEITLLESLNSAIAGSEEISEPERIIYRRLHKAASLLLKFRISQKNRLDWILTGAPRSGSPDFNALPVSDNQPASENQPGGAFSAWLTLCKWLFFVKSFPQHEEFTWEGVFDAAMDSASAETDIRKMIVQLTGWKEDDLAPLAERLRLKHPGIGDAVSDYARIGTYLRLGECFRLLKRVGVDASSMLTWARRDTDEEEEAARQIQQAVRSKYDYESWLKKITPLVDTLREKKRDALISYLLETSRRNVAPEISSGGETFANPMFWRDGDDLLRYFLIDVEMSACQLTSRIKQAIGSTQMFVQRCLLGYEKPAVEVSRAEKEETASDNNWKQWKWMKSYRLWEANRKVFLYPENWIEPELRDDKSPFFRELEAELSQNEISDKNAENALQHYLQKVHEVARLEVVGVYYELDDTDPRDDLPPDINVLHVIGRTRSHPAIYYYRNFDLNEGCWTAWEKIDLDIQGDQVVPVVYNRRLYLFWLHIVEKPQKVKKQPPPPVNADGQFKTSPIDTPEPPNQLEIQLGWSQQKDQGWTPARLSKQKLIHPWQRPLSSYNLKPRYKARENLLWLDIYLSQSQEFNDTRFWDAYKNKQVFVTSQRWDDTARPWHSSSFVFDGEVVDLRLRSKSGLYRVMDMNGSVPDQLQYAMSYQYIHRNFGAEGRAVNELSGKYEIAPRLPLPSGMRYHNTHLTNNLRRLNSTYLNVLDGDDTHTLLNKAMTPFEVIFSQHRIAFDTSETEQKMLFYQDNSRAYFIRREWRCLYFRDTSFIYPGQYRFSPFYHPWTALFMRELNRTGLPGLLNRQIQMTPQNYYPGNNFDFDRYGPTSKTLVDETAQKDTLDFECSGAYAVYNWELFFHAPLLIACRLSANQRFEEAMRWFHYIFDPTSTDSSAVPQRYWITRPFFEQNSEDYRQQRIDVLLGEINRHDEELNAWKNNPFKPHLIARFRPVAYQKAVVMKYLDNLIAWADQLFRRDTLESINEATTLYVLAHELLGRRPVRIPDMRRQEKSWNELTATGTLDIFANLAENYAGHFSQVIRPRPDSEPLPDMNLYFGIPANDHLLEYWKKIEDRLFKIRHCMNIRGVVRQLPLFEPPLDPALLVRAVAEGIDLDSLLTTSSQEVGPYRFQRLAQKAMELCGEVKSLGDKLLNALEKSDAEGLALLRSTHEIRMQQAVRDVRKQQIQEAKEALAGLEKSRQLVEEKQAFYEDRELANTLEWHALWATGLSALAEGTIAARYLLAALFTAAPEVKAGTAGWSGTPLADTTVASGKDLSKAAELNTHIEESSARTLDKMSSGFAMIGSWQQRKDEWDLQARLAKIEIVQIDKQILAAQIRLAMAEKELQNQDLQIEQSQAVDQYMRSKYTNQQLFDWQSRQISAIYFQSYELAFDLARRSEKAFQFEIGDESATFIRFGWDSLKQGLLAGEQLAADLHRMEAAWLEQNTRDLEITKHISLAQYYPLSLLMLKGTGRCLISIPEGLFDLDYPGHYRRRIKSVSITIPCVAGPYTSVNCTVTLQRHFIRYDDGTYSEAKLATVTTKPAIATSHGQNDSGLFELNFNDERYLPFEGYGAVSEWLLEMPQENRQFDYATISDVVLHLRYTARAGTVSRQQIGDAAPTASLPPSGQRLFVLNREFSSAWHQFLNPGIDQEQIFRFSISREHLPFYARDKNRITLNSANLVLYGASGEFQVTLKPPKGEEKPGSISSVGTVRQYSFTYADSALLLGDWKMQIKKNAEGGGNDNNQLKPEDIQTAYLVLSFTTA